MNYNAYLLTCIKWLTGTPYSIYSAQGHYKHDAMRMKSIRSTRMSQMLCHDMLNHGPAMGIYRAINIYWSSVCSSITTHNAI